MRTGRSDAIPADPFLARLAFGVPLNAVLAALGFALRGLDRGGAVAALGVGAWTFAAVGWRGYALLVAFWVVGTGATRLGYRRKRQAGLAEAGGGRRGAAQALAKGLVPAACAGLAAAAPRPEVFLVAFAGAVAAAGADTVSSEVGKLWGRRAYLLLPPRRAAPGVEGAVSVPGSLAGLGAAGALAGLGLALGLYGPTGWAAVTAGGVLADLLESAAGGAAERRQLLRHGMVNFLATLAGALIAASVYGLVVRPG